MDNLFRGIGVSFRDCKRLTIPMGYALRRSRLLVWSGQLCRGMSGNFAWNRRQLCGGISGSFYAESVATFGWNRWQLSRGIRTTAFVERHHGTDRNRKGRKGRKTACCSKDWQVHNAVTYFTMYSYNFCWPVRTLRVRQTAGGWQPRTPAMAAGLADHVWSLTEWLTFPVVQLR